MKQSARRREAGGKEWTRWQRMVVSALLVVHLVAILIGPRSPSILSGFLRQFYRPYLQAAYLDNGYKFFAPEPGPSYLIRYELEMDDGARVEGQLPDREKHWPRLLYHRHFMLSEFIPQFPSPEWSPELEWSEQPLSRVQEAYIRSYAGHLLAIRGARRVQLYLVRHRVPDPPEVLDGIELDDPSLYATRPLGSFDAPGERAR